MGAVLKFRLAIMGIDNMTIYPQKADREPIVIKTDLPKSSDLKCTTHCCCTAQSFYCDYPACCGSNFDSRFFCVSNQGALKCLQFEGNKTLNSGVSEHKCLDCRGDSTVCMESIESTICCFCVTGAEKAWFGCSDCDPCLWGGMSCFGFHIAGSKFGSTVSGSGGSVAAPAGDAKPADPPPAAAEPAKE